MQKLAATDASCENAAVDHHPQVRVRRRWPLHSTNNLDTRAFPHPHLTRLVIGLQITSTYTDTTLQYTTTTLLLLILTCYNAVT